MRHLRQTGSFWLISQALCFCLLLQGTGIAHALPLQPRQTFVSHTELGAALGRSPSPEPDEPSATEDGPLTRFLSAARSSAGEAGESLRSWLRDPRPVAASSPSTAAA